MSNFFFCHFVFKKPSAAEASESVYMRERVIYKEEARKLLPIPQTTNLQTNSEYI